MYDTSDGARHVGTDAPKNALPIGTRLGEFEVLGLVGEGGFGIVYLAHDHSLRRRVALKEYMPSALAGRGSDSQVILRTEKQRETFSVGLHSFVNEARILAQYDHPALIKVYRFWEANGTAYMAMPFLDGKNLREVLESRSSVPDEAWIRKIISPVMDALALIHADHCYHRDIAPDNIMLVSGERPVLLDFGAARQVINDMTKALTVILKPGYAPVEQYADMPGTKQGPWTDIYALAAVVYFMIRREKPPTSVSRLIDDTYVPLASSAAGKYGEAFLRGIDRCLAVKPEDRPQSIAEMRRIIGGESRAESASIAVRSSGTSDPQQKATSVPGSDGSRTAKAGPGSRVSLFLGLAVVVAGIVGGGVWFLTAHEDRTAASSELSAASQIPARVPSPAPGPVADHQPRQSPPVSSPAVATQVDLSAVPAKGGLAATSEPVSASGVAPRRFDGLGDLLDRAAEISDARLALRIDAPARVLIGSDLRLVINSKADGFIQAFAWDQTEDKVYRLASVNRAADVAVQAGVPLAVPPDGSKFKVRAPAGALRVFVFFAPNRLAIGEALFVRQGDSYVADRKAVDARLEAAGLGGLVEFPNCETGKPCREQFGLDSIVVVKQDAASDKVAKSVTKPAAVPQKQEREDAERQYMQRLNRDLDDLLGK